MKIVRWVSDALDVVRAFSPKVRREAGHQLNRVQHAKEPDDWKPMPNIGPGVNEIRIHAENEYRIIYIAKFTEAVYVLHAFVKKTQRIPRRDIDLVAKRYREIPNLRVKK